MVPVPPGSDGVDSADHPFTVEYTVQVLSTAAATIAMIPARRASGSRGHASLMAARSGSTHGV
jgi:hypothetical protein